MTTIHEVYETVRDARADGPEALAAMALSFGATMALGTLRIHALRGQIVELRAAQTAADEMVATLRHERDAALAECKAARQSVDEAKADAARLRALVESAADTAEVWRLRETVAALRADRARAVAEHDESMAAHDHTRAQWATACRERDEAREALVTAGKIAAEAVREREAFSLRASAVERQRDEARQERDAALARPTYEARKVAPTVAQWRGHFAAGGSWLVLRSTWSPLVVVDPDTYPGILGTEGATWLPLGPDGLPCAWPVVT